MLEREHPDAVCVFGPNWTHAPSSIDALDRGAHVLVEKPMATSATDARRMVEAAARNKKALVVAQQRRFSSIDKLAKEIVDRGVLGKVQSLRMRFSHGGPEIWAPGQSWFFSKKEAGGGVLLDLGVHLIDLALWILGEPATVTARIRTVRPSRDVEDNAVAIIEFKDGVTATVEVSWTSEPVSSVAEIHCDEGRALLGYRRGFDVTVARSDGNAVPGYSPEELIEKVGPLDFSAPYREVVSGFVAACRGEQVPFPSGSDVWRSVQVIEAAYESARTGRTVSVGGT